MNIFSPKIIHIIGAISYVCLYAQIIWNSDTFLGLLFDILAHICSLNTPKTSKFLSEMV